MTRYNSSVCYKEKSFKIEYETDNEKNYKKIQQKIRKQIDREDRK